MRSAAHRVRLGPRWLRVGHALVVADREGAVDVARAARLLADPPSA